MSNTSRPGGDTTWFARDRFGLFIHWGLYSLAARHEWVQNNERIRAEDYEARYLQRFDPDLYDPEVWAELAADAGMKYFVITTKHHEGFCLWDSEHTDYKATNTPAGRDLLRPMLDAFRSRGLRTGLYHSLIDWHHPDYIQDSWVGPCRDNPEREAMNAGRDQARYAAYLHAQVRELLTRYAPVDILWFDYSYPKPDGSGKGREDWQSEKLLKLVRELSPDVILDDRLDLGNTPGAWDVKTPEQYQPREGIVVDGRPVVWEACQTFSGSWGYHRDEQSWRSVEQLVQTLIDCVSKDGNLLLNVGPTGRGEFDDRAIERLRGIGRWMRRHSRSIYGCGRAPDGIEIPSDCRLTYNPVSRRLYVHCFAWPYKHLHIDGLGGKVEYAQLLNDASEVGIVLDDWHKSQETSADRKTLTLTLPQKRPDALVPVVELFLK